MIRVLKILLFGAFFLIHSPALIAEMNELHKAFYHQTGTQDKKKKHKHKREHKDEKRERTENMPASLEGMIDLGKVVFYFSEDPLINRLPSAQEHKGQNEVQTEFIVPMAQAQSAEAKTMLKKLNASSGPLYDGKPLYKVNVEHVTRPTQGLKVSISYDAQRVRYDMKSFDSISNQKGLVIRFYNQALLNEIQKRGTNVLQLGYAARPRKSIVVDCGHGGNDTGTPGFFNVIEKDVTLNVGLELAQTLKKNGFEVFLTRDRDIAVDLDARTTFANVCGADLFISLHANYNQNKQTCGLETYCLRQELFKQKMPREHKQLCCIVDACEATLYNRSAHLAHSIHTHTLEHGKKKYAQLADRTIRHSVAQVLLGTNMPAVLVELGFLSNKTEAELLSSKSYQKILAQGICQGIISYLKV